MEYKSDKVRVSEKYLIVHFTAAQGTSIRHATVKIPLEELVKSASVAEALDRATRRMLLEYWSGMPLDDEPLFDV